jgi:hypothetical protein
VASGTNINPREKCAGMARWVSGNLPGTALFHYFLTENCAVPTLQP